MADSEVLARQIMKANAALVTSLVQALQGMCPAPTVHFQRFLGRVTRPWPDCCRGGSHRCPWTNSARLGSRVRAGTGRRERPVRERQSPRDIGGAVAAVAHTLARSRLPRSGRLTSKGGRHPTVLCSVSQWCGYLMHASVVVVCNFY